MTGYMPPAKRTDWQTPPALFDALAEEFGPFDLDPCGDPLSYVSQHCGTYYAKGGLDKPWFGRVFVNPPYGREIGQWIKKAVEEVDFGDADLVVALLPVRTDTKWWQRYVLRSAWDTAARWAVEIGDHLREVRFLPGRLKFVGAKASAPFPSVVVVWGKP